MRICDKVENRQFLMLSIKVVYIQNITGSGPS